jgi:hypothetical protein
MSSDRHVRAAHRVIVFVAGLRGRDVDLNDDLVSLYLDSYVFGVEPQYASPLTHDDSPIGMPVPRESRYRWRGPTCPGGASRRTNGHANEAVAVIVAGLARLGTCGEATTGGHSVARLRKYCNDEHNTVNTLVP